MSHIPTPRSGLARPTRLPGPGFTAGRSVAASKTASMAANTKRPRGDSSDSDELSQASKRPKAVVNKTVSGSTASRSTVQSRTTRPGVARRPAGMSRPGMARNGAMLDRTNLNKTVASGQPSVSEKPKKVKRQPWDLKGRLEDMEAMFESTRTRVASLENQNSELQNNVEQKEVVVAQNTEELDAQKEKNGMLTKNLEQVKETLAKTREETQEESRKFKRTIEDLEYTKSSLERRTKGLEDELNAKQSELAGLRTTVAEVTSASAGIEAKLKSTEMQLEAARTTVTQLRTLSTEQAQDIKIYMEKQRAYETERRQLHNTIQELKGNIRVFCRVRPLVGAEVEKYDGQIKHIGVGDDKSLEILRPADSPSNTTASSNNRAERFQFDFDHVFGHESTQEDVFGEISQLVQSAIDGYNVCIFAYGQTGSGKTFTMEGDELGEQVGIIPRTITKIFEETHALTDKGWKYKMEASFLEIYNEEIRDLLATEKGLKYDIKKVDTKSSDIYVSNLKVEDVTSGANIHVLLKRAKKNRAVAATNCNERSSRSHSVFMLKITGHNSITSESCTGTLNLVDLAGSERLKDSGSTGLRLEETKNINSSLSNLSKVIMALASNKDGHIPYRDSKLTFLLMNCLGGNSKTLMFVNISPREDTWNETLNSLRFAKRVNNCQIGTASKKVNAV